MEVHLGWLLHSGKLAKSDPLANCARFLARLQFSRACRRLLEQTGWIVLAERCCVWAMDLTRQALSLVFSTSFVLLTSLRKGTGPSGR